MTVRDRAYGGIRRRGDSAARRPGLLGAPSDSSDGRSKAPSLRLRLLKVARPAVASLGLSREGRATTSLIQLPSVTLLDTAAVGLITAAICSDDRAQGHRQTHIMACCRTAQCASL